ncbi:unnamed protein product [Absidia cylindrospora]
MLVKDTLVLLCVFISCVWANTEKIIFSSDTTDCTSLSALTQPYQISTPFIHPYTSLQTSLPSPSVELYPLQDLATDSNYEVRLSYPATVPTDFQFTLVCNDSKSSIYGVLIEGTYAAVSNQPGVHKKPVPVNIVLEELAFGVVYHGIYRVILMIVFVLVLGYFILIPQIKRFLLQSIKDD